MHERVLPLEGGRNFRDLGGYRSGDGRQVKWRHLFRAGSTGDLTHADYELLAKLGLKVIFDLRATSECEQSPTAWQRLPNVTYWSRPYLQSLGNLEALLNSEVATAQEATATMIGIYQALPMEQAPAYRELFRLLADDQVPLVFNCSAGKDRTGVAAALVLGALGVAWDVIVEDYALSNTTFSPRPSHAPQYRIAPNISPGVIQAFGGTHASYLEAAFSAIGGSFGSVDGYLRTELAVTPEMLTAIRSNLLA